MVGFKLLDGVSKKELIEVATRLRDKNKCDLVVANDLKDIRNKEHEAYIIDKEDKVVEASDKEDIAKLMQKAKESLAEADYLNCLIENNLYSECLESIHKSESLLIVLLSILKLMFIMVETMII